MDDLKQKKFAVSAFLLLLLTRLNILNIAYYCAKDTFILDDLQTQLQQLQHEGDYSSDHGIINGRRCYGNNNGIVIQWDLQNFGWIITNGTDVLFHGPTNVVQGLLIKICII